MSSMAVAVSWPRALLALAAAVVTLYAGATAARTVARKHYVFLSDYIRWSLTPAPAVNGPRHLLVLFADHFEPNRNVDTVQRWMDRYERMASRHRDSSGRMPQHTWFYPAEQYEPAILQLLRDATQNKLGDVEFHFHHDYDTADTLRPNLEFALERLARFGFGRTIDGRTRFAFVHGNFGLDNSNGPFFCGVNMEMALLHELGAFADFTFPSVYMDSQPPFVNSIYAAADDPRPRSYDRAYPLRALETGGADLMILQGPLIFAPTWRVRRLFLELDDGDIHAAMPASAARVDRWVRANVHVPSRPEWVFIKLFGHSASSESDTEAATGADFDAMLDYMERTYNDGSSYVLHYVTAREAYNIAMAAVDGRTGSPVQYVNYRVAPYVAGERGADYAGTDAAVP